MDRFQVMQVFVRVVETGSFSRAALELGSAQPAATKAVAEAERHLGARLLHRSTRGVTPTEAGALYYERCKLILREVEDAENLTGLVQAGATGTLRINSSVAFGRRVLIPLVLRYMAEHPGLQIDLGFDDHYVNLVEQGVDLAIRIGRLADSSLGARYLGVNPWVLAAAPAYLAEHAAPRAPGELSEHPCLIYSSVQGDARWLLHGPSGEDESVPVRGPLRSNNLSAVLAACRAGMGLAMLPWYVARESVADASVALVLEEYTLPAQEMHVVYPSPKFVPAKVTAFIAWLQLQLAGAWWKREF